MQAMNWLYLILTVVGSVAAVVLVWCAVRAWRYVRRHPDAKLWPHYGELEEDDPECKTKND